MYAGSLNRKQILSVYIYWQDLKKCILFEQRHQGRQSVEALSVGIDCVKLQEITKQSAEAVPVLPCVMQTTGQEVSASVLAKFSALWFQE